MFVKGSEQLFINFNGKYKQKISENRKRSAQILMIPIMKRFVQLCEVREHHSRYLPTCIHFTRWRKQFARARTPLNDVWTLRIARCVCECVSCSCQRAQNAVRFIVKSCLRKQGKNIHIQSRAYTFHLK